MLPSGLRAPVFRGFVDNRSDVLRVVIGSLSQITAFSDAFRFSGK